MSNPRENYLPGGEYLGILQITKTAFFGLANVQMVLRYGVLVVLSALLLPTASSITNESTKHLGPEDHTLNEPEIGENRNHSVKQSDHMEDMGHTNDTSHGHHDEHGDPEVMSIATFIILTVLVGVTIIFEKLKILSLQKTSKFVRPVVHSAFGELTVLGFIGLMVFIIDFQPHKGGKSLIEHAVTGTAAENMTGPLKHLIEDLHMSLFLVMIIFLVQIGILLTISSKVAKKWEYFEHHRDQVDRVVRTYHVAKVSPQYLPHKTLLEEIEYHSLRQDFVNPRKGDIFATYSAPKPPPKVDRRFDFAEYLNLGLTHTLCEMVDIGLLGWLTLWVVAVFFWLFRYVDVLLVDPSTGSVCPVVTSYVLSLSGYALPVLLFVVSRKLKDAKKQLLPPRHQLYLAESDGVEEGQILQSMNVKLDSDYLDIPSYLKLKLPTPLDCCCCQKHTPTRQDNLFWFNVHGVELLRFIFSMELLLSSAYWGVLGVGLFPAIFDVDCPIPTWSKILLVFISVPPPIIVLVRFVHVMAEFVLTSFVEEKRSLVNVKKTLTSMKTRTVLRMLKLINAMHHTLLTSKLDNYLQQDEGDVQKTSVSMIMEIERCPAGFAPVPGHDNDWTDRYAGSTAKLQQEVEFGEVELPRRKPVYVRSKKLSKEEGTDVYFKFINKRIRRRASHKSFQSEESMQAYSDIFDAIDTDKSGSIDHDELHTLLMNKLGFKDVTDRTIQILINRLDTDNNGSINKVEFLRFFRKQIDNQAEETIHQIVQNVFKYMDSDDSGTISTTEFMETIRNLDNGTLTREDIDEIVYMTDVDRSGEISLEELTTLLEDASRHVVY